MSRGVPDKPMGLSQGESALWDQFMRDLPANVLKDRDPRLLHLLCSVIDARDRAYQVSREDVRNEVAFNVTMHLIDSLTELSKVFGLSPLDRQDLEVPEDDDDDFVDWMRGNES